MRGFLVLAVRDSALLSSKNSRGFGKKQVAAVSTQRIGNSNKKVMWELRNFVCTIDYDGHFVWNTRGSVKSFGLGVAVCS